MKESDCIINKLLIMKEDGFLRTEILGLTGFIKAVVNF
jgi:hypothetical protein